MGFLCALQNDGCGEGGGLDCPMNISVNFTYFYQFFTSFVEGFFLESAVEESLVEE